MDWLSLTMHKIVDQCKAATSMACNLTPRTSTGSLLSLIESQRDIYNWLGQSFVLQCIQGSENQCMAESCDGMSSSTSPPSAQVAIAEDVAQAKVETIPRSSFHFYQLHLHFLAKWQFIQLWFKLIATYLNIIEYCCSEGPIAEQYHHIYASIISVPCTGCETLETVHVQG